MLMQWFMLVMALLMPAMAEAQCYVHGQVLQMARTIAAQKFPRVANRMPQVEVCNDVIFPGNVLAHYQSPAHRVELRQSLLGSNQLETVIVHELAHAEVWLQYGERPAAQGHGQEWMLAMMRIGYSAEAQRIAAMVPGAQSGFQTAMSQFSGESAWPGGAVVTQGPQTATMFATAEAEARSMSCHQILVLPPGASVNGYQLSSSQHLAFMHLPRSTNRVQSLYMRGPNLVEIVTSSSPDGTQSLVCVM